MFCFADETQSAPQVNGSVVAPEPMAISAPPTPESPGPSACPLLPTPTTPQPPPATSSSPGCGSSDPEQTGTVTPGAPSVTPSNPETEEDKAKKLLYCSLCKVAVNSLSQLEAHNKGENSFSDSTSKLNNLLCCLITKNIRHWNKESPMSAKRCMNYT